jgi:hypothetical protein
MPEDSLIDEMRAALALDRAAIGRRAKSRSSVVPQHMRVLTPGAKRGFLRRLLRRR